MRPVVSADRRRFERSDAPLGKRSDSKVAGRPRACVRPVERVLYAIENGGFSGAYMPQNIVVGKQAREIADFVARFAGRQAPLQPNVEPCTSKPLDALPLTGSIPELSSSSSSSS